MNTGIASPQIYFDGKWLLAFGPHKLNIFCKNKIPVKPQTIVSTTLQWKWLADLPNHRVVYWEGKNIYTYDYISKTRKRLSLRKILYFVS